MVAYMFYVEVPWPVCDLVVALVQPRAIKNLHASAIFDNSSDTIIGTKLSTIHTHAYINVCDFAINGSIYVLCLNIALVLIFYYDVINFSHSARSHTTAAAAATSMSRPRASQSAGITSTD